MLVKFWGMYFLMTFLGCVDLDDTFGVNMMTFLWCGDHADIFVCVDLVDVFGICRS